MNHPAQAEPGPRPDPRPSDPAPAGPAAAAPPAAKDASSRDTAADAAEDGTMPDERYGRYEPL